MMKYIVTINNKKYEVEVEKGQANIVKTTEAAVQTSPAIQTASPVSAQAVPAATAPVKGNPVKAPMPGTILGCNTAEGARVKKGDVLFVLEAMKMENEIVSPVDGVVLQITAAKGSSVSTGDTLAVIQS